MGNKIKRLLFVLVMFILLCPLLQQTFNLIKIEPLLGAIVNSNDTIFSFEGWLNRTYQEKKENYLKDSFGFRNIMIRVNNQIAYWVDNEARANGIIIGKFNYLYDEAYIKSYYGVDFIGEKAIDKKIEMLKEINSKFKEKNISLIVILSPDKGNYFPEYFPERYDTIKSMTNNECYAKKLKSSDINTLDLNNYFLKQKPISKYPLFTKYGIHWSTYGKLMAFDMIIKTLEKTRNIDLPDLNIQSINVTYEKIED